MARIGHSILILALMILPSSALADTFKSICDLFASYQGNAEVKEQIKSVLANVAKLQGTSPAGNWRGNDELQTSVDKLVRAVNDQTEYPATRSPSSFGRSVADFVANKYGSPESRESDSFLAYALKLLQSSDLGSTVSAEAKKFDAKVGDLQFVKMGDTNPKENKRVSAAMVTTAAHIYAIIFM